MKHRNPKAYRVIGFDQYGNGVIMTDTAALRLARIAAKATLGCTDITTVGIYKAPDDTNFLEDALVEEFRL